MSPELEKQIRDRAYAIWQAEGEPEGRDSEHWMKARAEFEDAQGETPAVSSRGAAGVKAPAKKRSADTTPSLSKPKSVSRKPAK